MTCKLLAIIRLLLPNALLPATTALATLDPRGCEKGMLAGANVVMPNPLAAGRAGKVRPSTRARPAPRARRRTRFPT